MFDSVLRNQYVDIMKFKICVECREKKDFVCFLFTEVHSSHSPATAISSSPQIFFRTVHCGINVYIGMYVSPQKGMVLMHFVLNLLFVTVCL